MKIKNIKLRASNAQFLYNDDNLPLLNTLESQGVVVEYQCRMGFCGSCRTKIHSGSVSYRQKPLALINDGEILPCCCYPETDIEIEL